MTESERSAAVLRAIPKVDRLLGTEELQPLLAAHSREEVVRELRRVLENLRRKATSWMPPSSAQRPSHDGSP
ncbi:MAG TPA: hypothetical protein VLX28_27635, partial [Thermoanaerobaculia bacterium]|nr:hypothetical protein [Thermoanaerobaculia bacterium]